MSSLSCSCGKTLKYKPEHEGKKVRCPSCATIVTIPRSTIPDELDLGFSIEAPSEPEFVAAPEPPPVAVPSFSPPKDSTWSDETSGHEPSRKSTTSRQASREVVPLPKRPALKLIATMAQFASYVAIGFSLLGMALGLYGYLQMPHPNLESLFTVLVVAFGGLAASVAYLAYAELLKFVLDVDVRLHEISTHLASRKPSE